MSDGACCACINVKQETRPSEPPPGAVYDVWLCRDCKTPFVKRARLTDLEKRLAESHETIRFVERQNELLVEGFERARETFAESEAACGVTREGLTEHAYVITIVDPARVKVVVKIVGAE
ncbi:MAG: hypothetical protein ACREXY_13290 [Gammaproteobacteria bacterium]